MGEFEYFNPYVFYLFYYFNKLAQQSPQKIIKLIAIYNIKERPRAETQRLEQQKLMISSWDWWPI